MEIYTIYDLKSEQHAMPFFQQNDVTALRTLRTTVNTADPNNQLYHNSEDFVLKHIGTFDIDTGELTPAKPRVLVNAGTLRTKE